MPPSLVAFMSPSWEKPPLFGGNFTVALKMMFLSFGPISCPSKSSVKNEGFSSVRAGKTGCSYFSSISPSQRALQLIASLVFLKTKYLLLCFYLFSHHMKKGQNSCDYDFDLAPSKTIISPLLREQYGGVFFSTLFCHKRSILQVLETF